MREQLKAYAPYITVFGLVVLLASAVAPRLAQQSGATAPEWLGTALLVAGAVLALAWPLLRPEDVAAAFGARQVRYGGNALVLVAAVLAILVALNFLSTRRYRAWDLTTNKQFTVSRQTVQIVQDLQQPVALTAILGAADSETDSLQRLLDQYKAETDKLTYTRIDPQLDLPELLGLAQRLNLGQNVPGKALVAESGGRHAIVYSFDEQAVTEAIVKASRTRDKTVAFLTGHGEHDITGGGTDGRGYASVKQGLEREGYTVTTQSLSAVTTTLTADAVVIAGPQQPFQPEEAELLADYVEGGGAVLMMLDPGGDSGLGPVLLPWEIRPHGDLVLQSNALFGVTEAAVAVVNQDYQFHSITKDLNRFETRLVGTQSFGVGTPVTTALQVTKLIEVGGNAGSVVWGEKDLAGLQNGQAQADPTDEQPPLTLAVAAEGGEGYGRVVVFGTSNLASDGILQRLGQAANYDLVLNAVNWLTTDEDLISIRPTEPDNRPISPPQSPALLLLVTAVLVPLAIFGIAAWIWWRRR